MPQNGPVHLKIYRYDPDTGEPPRMQDYIVQAGYKGTMVLDLLMQIKSDIDDSLSFRRSCREGVCGSDAMNINGKNGLACVAPIATTRQPIVLRPLPGVPVVRDLIVDLSEFWKQYHSIKPYLVNDDPPPDGERLQSPEDRDKLNGLYECILCACCSTPAPPSGGIRTASSARPGCCRPTASLPTRATARRRNGSTTSATPIACFAAAPS